MGYGDFDNYSTCSLIKELRERGYTVFGEPIEAIKDTLDKNNIPYIVTKYNDEVYLDLDL